MRINEAKKDSIMSISPQQKVNLRPEQEKYIKGFSWGAFLATPVWAIIIRYYWAILFCLPSFFIPIIPAVVIAILGRRWAWKYVQWNNFEEYYARSRKADKVSVLLWLVSTIVATITGILLAIFIS